VRLRERREENTKRRFSRRGSEEIMRLRERREEKKKLFIRFLSNA